jgi:hypothetical protein
LQTQQQESHRIKRRIIAIRWEGQTVNWIAPHEKQVKFSEYIPISALRRFGKLKMEYFTGLIQGSWNRMTREDSRDRTMSQFWRDVPALPMMVLVYKWPNQPIIIRTSQTMGGISQMRFDATQRPGLMQTWSDRRSLSFSINSGLVMVLRQSTASFWSTDWQ